jgi:hypothetical protein
MSSPPVLVWTSRSTACSVAEGMSPCWIVLSPGSSLQIQNLGRDPTGLNMVAASGKVIFNEMVLSLDKGEFIMEVVKLVVVVMVAFDFSRRIPVVEVSNSFL